MEEQFDLWPSHVSLYVDCHVCLDRYARENDNRFGGNEEREGRCCPEYESPGYEECVAMLQGPDGGRFESFAIPLSGDYLGSY